MMRPPFPRRSPAAVLAAALLASACTLAPVYERPAAPIPTAYPADAPAVSTAAGTADNGARAPEDWSQAFLDPRLRQLVVKALERNRDLRLAALRIEEARALYAIQASASLPSIDASGGLTQGRAPLPSAQGGGSAFGQEYRAAVGVSAFELDFFGRVRSLNQAMLAEYLATEEARRAAQVALVAEVATVYAGHLALAEQADLAGQALESREAALKIARARHARGLASAIELSSAETQAETARAALAERERLRRQALHALQLLVGDFDERLAPQARLDDLKLLPLAAGLPADLLERRPDIRQAEQRLRGANANIGAARAAFFPSVQLTGEAGTASPSFAGLFDAGTRLWSFAPRITLPIFAGGRNKASLDLAEVRKDMAVVAYEQAIQTAFREVADALAAREQLAVQWQAQRRIAAGERERLRLAQRRHEKGVAGYLEVLDAQRSQFESEQALVDVRRLVVANDVTLFRALGGGWSTAER